MPLEIQPRFSLICHWKRLRLVLFLGLRILLHDGRNLEGKEPC